MSALTLTPKLQLRAVAIADECMRAVVECEGVGLPRSRDSRYGLTDENQREVRSIEDASASLREAFEYLRDRGLALLTSDRRGDVIEILVERFA